MDQINDLKKERDKLRIKIREWMYRQKDAYKFVVRFNELTEELKKSGRNVSMQAECLILSNWEKGGKYYHLREFEEKKSPIAIEKDITIEKDIIKEESLKKLNTNINNYKIQLYWTNISNEDAPKIIKELDDYFQNLGLKYLDEDIFFDKNKIEHTVNYSFKGIEEEFNMLKKSSQYIIDTFSNNKFTVAVGGRKLKK